MKIMGESRRELLRTNVHQLQQDRKYEENDGNCDGGGGGGISSVEI